MRGRIFQGWKPANEIRALRVIGLFLATLTSLTLAVVGAHFFSNLVPVAYLLLQLALVLSPFCVLGLMLLDQTASRGTSQTDREGAEGRLALQVHEADRPSDTAAAKHRNIA